MSTLSLPGVPANAADALAFLRANKRPRRERDPNDKRVWVSPSQIKTHENCNRWWAFLKIDRLKDPKTRKSEDGNLIHEQLEMWLRWGILPDDSYVGLAAKALIRGGWLPAPSPRLLVETDVLLDGYPGLPDDVVLNGYADCIDPYDAVPVVNDHKSTSDLKWAMTADPDAEPDKQIQLDPQAHIYVAYVNKHFGAPRVRVRWGYVALSTPKDGGPRKVKGSRLVDHTFDCGSSAWADAWGKTCEKVVAVRQSRLTLTRAMDAPATVTSCGMYGGCPFRGGHPCVIPPEDVLAAHIARFDREHAKRAERLVVLTHSGVSSNPTDNGATPQEVMMSDEMAAAIAARKSKKAAPVAAATPAAAAPVETAPDPLAEAAAKARKSAKATAGTPGTAAPPPAPPADGGLFARLQAEAAQVGINPPEGAAKGDGLPRADATIMPAAQAAKVAETVAAVDAKASVAETKPAAAEPKAGVAEKPSKRSPAAGPKHEGAVARDELVVMFDCVFAKNESLANGVHQLADIIVASTKKIADDNKLPHWGLVEYAKGPSLLAALFDAYLEATQLKGVILADSSTAETQAVKEVLRRRASVVVQGVR